MLRYLDRAAVVIALCQVLDALNHAPAGIRAIVSDLIGCSRGTVVGNALGRGIGGGASRYRVIVANRIGLNLVQVYHRFEVLAMIARVGEAHAHAMAQVLFEG